MTESLQVTGDMALRDEVACVDGEMDSERRPLRPIGASADDIHGRTGRLLARFTARPGVRLFSRVPVEAGEILIPYAISAGRLLVLVDTAAWPAGDYSTDPDGGVLCDGTYIGQSVGHLINGVRQLRRTLPNACRIEAVVVVHPSLPTAPTLPSEGPAELRWLAPAGLAVHLRRRLHRATFCLSDINRVTLCWPSVTPGCEGGS